MSRRSGWGWRAPRCKVCGCQAVTADEGDYLCARCYASRTSLREAAEFLAAQQAKAEKKPDDAGQQPVRDR